MIIKARQLPIKIIKLEALLRRLLINHTRKKSIEEELAMSYAGYHGEKSMSYYFSYILEKKYLFLHDLRLFDENYYFQIDTLIVTPRFILIVEIKNYLGTVYFDNAFNQLIRTYNGKEDAFPDPLLQVKGHQTKLEALLLENKVPHVPLHCLVVFSNPQTIIKAAPSYKEVFQKVTTSQNFLNKFEKIEQQHKVEKLDNKEMKRVSRLLFRKHNPLNPELLKQFNISKSEILTGVHCPKCFKLHMVWKAANWHCSCTFSSKDAHLDTLKDYELLVNSSITNQELRSFLHIPSRHTATRLLNSMNLPSSGTGKGKVYHLKTENILN